MGCAQCYRSYEYRWSMWVEGPFDGPPTLTVEPAPAGS